MRLRQLPEPAVGSAVRDGAGGQQPCGCRRNRVVTDAAYARCLEIARGHYENFPVASRLLPARCGRTSPRSTPSPARPTTSPTRATGSDEKRLALLDDWRDRLHRPRPATSWPTTSTRRRSFARLPSRCGRIGLELELFDDLLERVSAGRARQPIRRLGRRPGLLPAIGQSRRPSGPEARRLSRRTAGRALGRGLHGAAAHELLAGSSVDWRKGRLYVPQSLVRETGADDRGPAARPLTPEWRAALGSAAADDADAFRRRAARSPTPCAAGSSGSCARPGSAACASSIGSKPALRRLCLTPIARLDGRGLIGCDDRLAASAATGHTGPTTQP